MDIYVNIRKENKMQYYQIKERMVELVKILKVNPRKKKNWYIQTVRKQLAKLIKRNKLAWMEVQ